MATIPKHVSLLASFCRRSLRAHQRPFTTRSTTPPPGVDQYALPLVFLSSSLNQTALPNSPKTKTERISSKASIWTDWEQRFAKEGYASVSITLDDVSDEPMETWMSALEADLVAALKSETMPFPPLLFAHSANTLIAQTYVSSHPLSGLVLFSPPLNNQEASRNRWLPEHWPEFTFEPRFPLAICEGERGVEKVGKHRLLDEWDGYVDLVSVPASGGLIPTDVTAGYDCVKRWMDDNGL